MRKKQNYLPSTVTWPRQLRLKGCGSKMVKMGGLWLDKWLPFQLDTTLTSLAWMFERLWVRINSLRSCELSLLNGYWERKTRLLGSLQCRSKRYKNLYESRSLYCTYTGRYACTGASMYAYFLRRERPVIYPFLYSDIVCFQCVSGHSWSELNNFCVCVCCM